QAVREAVATQDLHMLEEAMKQGRQHDLQGQDADGERWMCPEMRDAHLLVHKARERMQQAAIQNKYKKLMANKFVRTEPLGSDREGRRYWVFEGDERIHVETITRKENASPLQENLEPPSNPEGATIITVDEPEAQAQTKPKPETKPKASRDLNPVQPGPTSFVGSSSVRATGTPSTSSAGVVSHELSKYHPVWYQSSWNFYETEDEFHTLILSLDRRGRGESEVKDALQERFDIAELERNVQDRAANVEMESVPWQTGGSEHIGKRVRRVFGRRVAEAVITKWVPAEDNEGMALWHVEHEDGDEVT
ncbi:unnamed protein product, partial [Discosporangium mesarthrocarpum]